MANVPTFADDGAGNIVPLFVDDGLGNIVPAFADDTQDCGCCGEGGNPCAAITVTGGFTAAQTPCSLEVCITSTLEIRDGSSTLLDDAGLASLGVTVTWLWDDGSSTTGLTPGCHTYAAPGSRTIGLYVQRGGNTCAYQSVTVGVYRPTCGWECDPGDGPTEATIDASHSLANNTGSCTPTRNYAGVPESFVVGDGSSCIGDEEIYTWTPPGMTACDWYFRARLICVGEQPGGEFLWRVTLGFVQYNPTDDCPLTPCDAFPNSTWEAEIDGCPTGTVTFTKVAEVTGTSACVACPPGGPNYLVYGPWDAVSVTFSP